jgi:hypothetical protein
MEGLITLVVVLAFVYLRDRHTSKLNYQQFNRFMDTIKVEEKPEEIISMKEEEKQDEIIELSDLDPDELIEKLHGNN